MILILGGTSDSLEIAQLLSEAGLDYYLSVATEYGSQLAKACTDKVLLGRMDERQMEDLIGEKQIQLIVDATHPYAIEVSKNAITASNHMNIGYMRFERPSLLAEIHYDKLYIVESIDEACYLANDMGKNIFLGTGSKNLREFTAGLQDKNVIVRVLPTSEVINQCEQLGLDAGHIIAMKGPFSEQMNEVTYKQYQIDCVITKESGQQGGFFEKVKPCEKMDIPVIVIKRKSIVYSNSFSQIDTLIEAVCKVVSHKYNKQT